MLAVHPGPEPIFENRGKRLRVLDLFCGDKGWSRAFKERGHHVVTVDINERFDPDICADIHELTIADLGTDWDIVLASPPCECFSIASCRYHWSATEPRVPKSKEADDALQLVQHTYQLIQEINPLFWAIENPTGMLRKVWKPPAHITHFASWAGGRYEYRRVKKSTDIWGRLPRSLPWPEPRVWEKAERGTKRGTQGMFRGERALIPWGFSFTFCVHAEIETLAEIKTPNYTAFDNGETIAKSMLDRILNTLPAKLPFATRFA
jgi:hypothetical protein